MATAFKPGMSTLASILGTSLHAAAGRRQNCFLACKAPDKTPRGWMGKKEIPEVDLGTKPIATWSSDDVKLWLTKHESCHKYTKTLKAGS